MSSYVINTADGVCEFIKCLDSFVKLYGAYTAPASDDLVQEKHDE